MSRPARVLRILGLALWLPLTCLSPLQAEPLDPEKFSIKINLFEITASLPAPSWQKTMDTMAESKVFKKQTGPQFIFELIPKGDKFESWSKIYAAYALKSSTTTFKNFINGSLGVFFQACGKENFGTQLLGKSDTARLYLIMCQSTGAGPAKLGYGKDIGEATLMMLSQHRSTLVKIYHSWRGPKFSKTDNRTWPVAKSELQEMVRRFKGMSLTPLQPAQ